jgi:DNA-directed RNA polymerase subunit M/transcription elongation factor TFIIS
MDSADRQFRLAKEHYAGLTEGEIGALANEAYNLTEIAREALASVISERGLDLELKTGPATVPPAPSLGPCDRLDIDDSELVSYGWAMNEEGLKYMKAWLTAVGTACFIGPDKVLEPKDYQGGFANGVNVRIRRVDRRHTLAALEKLDGPGWPSPHVFQEVTGEQPDNEQEQVDNEEQRIEIRCPRCNSAEVVFEGRDCKDSDNPPPTAKYKWSCGACDNQWQDEGIVP